MNNFPDRLLALAEALSDADAVYGRLDEGVTHLDVRGSMDEAAWRLWRGVLDEAAMAGIGIVFADEADEPIDTTSEAVTDRVKIRIAKPNTAAVYHAFSDAGTVAILEDGIAGAGARRILVARGVAPFQTESCSFDIWSDGSSEAIEDDPLAAVEPRRLVYETSPGLVPQRIGHLLLKGAWPTPSDTLTVWKAFAFRRLPLTLVNEVRSGRDSIVLLAKGLRTVPIPFDANGPIDDELVTFESEAARWIFGNGTGVENRHTFFTAELSRIWPESESWNVGLRRVGAYALEGAKSANNLMLSGTTSDVLKALGDLRKTMNDEVARVAQQSRDLSGALWRDFVIAVTALSARAALSASTSVVTTGVRLLLGFAAMFLFYSLYVAVTGNRAVLQAARKSRIAWTTRVYQFVSEADLDALVAAPLTEIETIYFKTEGRVIAAYGLVIIVIIASALWQQPASDEVGRLWSQLAAILTGVAARFHRP
jgi:hypothetical protein